MEKNENGYPRNNLGNRTTDDNGNVLGRTYDENLHGRTQERTPRTLPNGMQEEREDTAQRNMQRHTHDDTHEHNGVRGRTWEGNNNGLAGRGEGCSRLGDRSGTGGTGGTNCTKGTTGRCGGNTMLDTLMPGYVYAPDQRFCMLHSAENALARGTLFEELYKPMEVYGCE